MKWLLLVLFFYGGAGGFKKNNETDYIIEPLYVKFISGEEETVADYTYWDIKNVARVFYLDGNYTFTKDMDNTYMRKMNGFYSSMGNSKFEKMPFRLPDLPMCDFYNTSYRKYIEPIFIGKTNFPTLPPEGLCPIPKGSYWAKGITMNLDILPSHIPRGTWRLEERFYSTKPKRSMVGGIDAYARILDRYG